MERVKPTNALYIPVLNNEPETHSNYDQTHQSVSRVLISV